MSSMFNADAFSVEIDTIRDLTPSQADLVAGGLRSEPDTASTTSTTLLTTLVPGTEWTAFTTFTTAF